MYQAKAADLKRVYAQIAKNIRGHYALTFNASDVANPRIWRNIRVSTTRPNVIVLSNKGYCPDTPCQKADGTFVGGTPRNWNQVMSLNSDAAVVSSVKQQLHSLIFGYTRETETIVNGLSEHPLLVEKHWNAQDRNSKPYFVTHAVSGANESVSVDLEACGVMLAPEHNVPSREAVNSFAQRILEVDDPEIRLSRRPTSSSSPKAVLNDQDDYFQSQAIFYLIDRSGGIPYPLKVQCRRPHFLVGNGLVEFASQAISEALKLTPESDRPVSGGRDGVRPTDAQ